MRKIIAHLFTLVFILTGLLVTPNFAQAFVYTSITNANINRLLVERNLLDDDKKVYDCQFMTMTCSLYDSSKDTPTVQSTNPYASTLKKYLSKNNMSYTYSSSYRWVAFLKHEGTASLSTRTFYLIDLKNDKAYKKSEKITFWDAVTEIPTKFAFSPDETKFVYIDDYAGPMMLHVVDLTNQKSFASGLQNNPIIKDEAYNVGTFTVDNKNIYFTAHGAQAYDWKVYKYNFTDKTLVSIANNASYVDKLRVLGQNLVFQEVDSGTKVPAVYNLNTGKIAYFDKFIPDKTPLPGDRTEMLFGKMHGVLINPKNILPETERKLVVWMHGGPPRQAAFGYHPYASYATYDWALDELVKHGVSVLKIDYKGSQNYGRYYNDAIKYQVGLGDVVDVVEAINETKKKIKVESVSLIGNSYGGYLGLKTLVEHPEKVDSVFSINGVTDWWNLIAKIPWSPFTAHFGGLPSFNKTPENIASRKKYDASAIVNKISKIGDQKIIIGHGTKDGTINPNQASLIYGLLKKQNKNANLVWYEDEDHVFVKTKSIENICRNMFETIGLESLVERSHSMKLGKARVCVFPKSQ